MPSKTTLGINEKLRVEFTMNKDGDNFSPPSFQGFQATGPSQMISNSWVNGKRSFSKSYTYMLIPTAKGTFTVGQATIEIDGKVYKTIPFKVTVGEPWLSQLADNIQPLPLLPQRQMTVQNAGKGIHLVAEVSEATLM